MGRHSNVDGIYLILESENNKKYTVLQIRVFQLVGSCNAECKAIELHRRHVKNQQGSKRALEWGCGKVPGMSPKKLWCFYRIYNYNKIKTK